ncbi:MAG TPA: VCBS repeat-containing protein, partial [Roseiflexaceae bacterium]
MKHVTLGLLLALTLLGSTLAPARAHPAPLSALLINPAPKWGYKGCTSWCQTGWYASPAVADLNGDGKPEVIWSAYSIYVVDGATG